MKKKAKELDVDFIGGQNHPLTKEELSSISAFIKQLKVQRNRPPKRKVKKLKKQPAL